MLETIFVKGTILTGQVAIPFEQDKMFYVPRVGDLRVGAVQACCCVVDMNYSKNSYVYLPYVPGHINFCIQGGRDVISAPFSGCLMVKFVFNGACIFSNNLNACPYWKGQLPCAAAVACPFRGVDLVAHVSYDSNPLHSCRNKWRDNILLQSTNVVGFHPDTPMGNVLGNMDMGDNLLYVYGLITAQSECYSIFVKRHRKSGVTCVIDTVRVPGTNDCR